jgi:ketosteroid isomerase-like protein
VLSAGVLLAGACAPNPVPNAAPQVARPAHVSLVAPAEVARGVRETVAAMEAAFASGTPARVAEHYTEDALLLAPGMETAGRVAIARVWTSVPPGRRWRLELAELGGGPEEPWSRGRSHLTWVDDAGATHTRTSVVLAVWRRQPDGQYRLHRDVMLPEPTRAARP